MVKHASSPLGSVFISHASEDKELFVRKFASCLRMEGVNVWYDEFRLNPGDSITRSIEKGLMNSQFGIVILSESFFQKYWTMEESAGLRSLESAGKLERIIPIWLNLDHSQVLQHAPLLADRFAIVTNGEDINDVVSQTLKVVDPSLFSIGLFRKNLRESLPHSKKVSLKVTEVKRGSVRHENFSAHFRSRIRLLQVLLEPVFPSSIEEWLDNFSRDTNPHRELVWWEFLAYIYIGLANILTSYESKNLFTLTFQLVQNADINSLSSWLKENSSDDQYKEAIRFLAAANEANADFGLALQESDEITTSKADY